MKCVFFCACVQLKESWGERATAAVAAGSRREKLLCMCVCSFVREPLTKRRHKMKKGLFAPAQPEKHVHKTETHYPHFTMPPIHPPQHVRTTQPAQHATLHTARISSRFDSAQMNARCAHVAHRDAPLLPLLLLARSSLAKCTEKMLYVMRVCACWCVTCLQSFTERTNFVYLHLLRFSVTVGAVEWQRLRIYAHVIDRVRQPFYTHTHTRRRIIPLINTYEIVVAMRKSFKAMCPHCATLVYCLK